MFKYFGTLFKTNDQQSPRNNDAIGESIIPALPINKKTTTAIIAIANQKGGCGKTTTTINLSAALAKMGHKTLIIDLDAQSQSSLGIGINADDQKYSLYDVMVKNLDLQKAIVPTDIQNLDIAPASAMLTGAQIEMASQLGREWILRTAVNKMITDQTTHYDYIIMDCSPSLNVTTINGLSCAKFVLIPAQTHYFSLEGIKELISTICTVKERLNPQLQVLGILPTLYDIRTSINRQILSQMRKFFKEVVFDTTIRSNIKLVEAQVHKQSIYQYSPNSNGAKDYLALSKEVVSRTDAAPAPRDTSERSVDIEDRTQSYELTKA